MLKIKALTVNVEGKPVLNGVNLNVNPGEVHAIMGPNGSGKSTLSNVLAGKSEYQVISGKVQFSGNDFLTLSPEERALQGLFLGFQYPVEIPGVSTENFLRTALNEKLKYEGKEELDAFDFQQLLSEKLQQINMDKSMTDRSLNQGFSGGEKKRNQLLVLRRVLVPGLRRPRQQ
mgnify:FL=1